MELLITFLAIGVGIGIIAVGVMLVVPQDLEARTSEAENETHG
jgi:hypothetical protein